jgi:hypothetical protein
MTDWTPAFPDLPVLDDLGAQLAAAAAAAEVAGRRRAPRRSLRLALVVSASVLLLAAAAFAATRIIDVGEKVPPFTDVPQDAPSRQDASRTSRLVPLRVADPAGGPPWGIRLFRMPNDLACVQVGRVVGDRVGVLGSEGAFGDDGRFHALPAQGAMALKCGRRDGAGRLALTGFGGPRTAGAADAYLATGRGPIPPEARRTVEWGFAGPKATRVTYTAPGIRRTYRTRAADEWAYLFVLRGAHREGRRLTITYAGGRTCAWGAGVRRDESCLRVPGLVRSGAPDPRRGR